MDEGIIVEKLQFVPSIFSKLFRNYEQYWVGVSKQSGSKRGNGWSIFFYVNHRVSEPHSYNSTEKSYPQTQIDELIVRSVERRHKYFVDEIQTASEVDKDLDAFNQ